MRVSTRFTAKSISIEEQKRNGANYKRNPLTRIDSAYNIQPRVGRQFALSTCNNRFVCQEPESLTVGEIFM